MENTKNTNENHYALIIVLINEMNQNRTKSEFEKYKMQYFNDLKLLNALLIITNLTHLEDDLTAVKGFCLSKVSKDDLNCEFKGYPIHSIQQRKTMLSFIK